jgi:glycerophosphoryl diester phosphodiesterase
MISALLIIGSTAAVAHAQDPYAAGPWRRSLDDCWTEGPSCTRVMTVSHGGDWNAQYPYDSLPAFQNAYNNGADAVKGDFRVSKDNIGVVMHSSPVEFYESFNCRGKKVEEMTAAECTQCEMIYTNYTFITVPDMLAWADGKINVMYCVKESTDIPRAVSTLIENSAQHRAFLEIGVDEMLNIATTSEGWQEVYFVIEIHNAGELQRYFNGTTLRSF